MKSNIGEIKRVENHNKHNLASLEYVHVFVYDGDDVVSIMLTENELEVAKERSRRNTEDRPDLQKPQVIIEGVDVKKVTHDKGNLIIEL